jgi:hypothetical protein
VFSYINRFPSARWLGLGRLKLCVELVEGGVPIGGFLYEVNEWRGIYIWEN